MAVPLSAGEHPRQALWNCLNSIPPAAYSQQYLQEKIDYWGERHRDNDLIGLGDISCIEIDHYRDRVPDFQHRILDGDRASEWLGLNRTQAESRRLATTDQSVICRARILIGHQTEFKDGLYVFDKLQQSKVSKKLVFESLQIPGSVIERMGLEQNMSLQFPQSTAGESSTNCHAVAGCAASIAWTYNTITCDLAAFVVVRQPGRHYSDRLFYLLESLAAFSRHMGYLPFILVDIEVCKWSETLAYFEQVAAENRVRIERFLGGPLSNPNEVFSSAAVRAGALADIRIYAPSVMEMITRLEVLQLGQARPRDVAFESAENSLREAILYRQRELSILLNRSETLNQQTTTMLSTVMGLMSFNQQAVTAEIAQATRRDSTSMRTLAIVAMIFLPMTAVSAIMSIPVFNWNATSNSQIADSRLWIFFAVAVPLTAITMVGVWYWVRVENESYDYQDRPKDSER